MNRNLYILRRRTGWMLALLAGSMLAHFPGGAQNIDKMSGNQLMQLMLAQPKLSMDRPVEPTATFDPPAIAVGGHAIYRVTLRTLDEAITKWPDKMPAPPQLEMVRGAQGMTFKYGPGTMQPLTEINFHVTATQAGEIVMPSYTVQIYGKPLTIPEARLNVMAADHNLPGPAELGLRPERTKVYTGESIRVRVTGPPSRTVQPLSEVHINGDGFITSKTEVMQQITMVHQPNGGDVPAFIYETSLTPFAQGPLDIFAQAFRDGQFGRMAMPGGGSDSILLESPHVILNVSPLPTEGRLPGFMGAIGQFKRDEPELTATIVEAGNPVKLSVTMRSTASVTHLAMPPAIETPAWQVFNSASPAIMGTSATFTFTLIPQTDQTAATPEIPFSYFDPETEKYVDLSIPAMPIHVTPSANTAAGLADFARPANAAPQKKNLLSSLAPSPGPAAASLTPLQERHGFWLVELAPVLALAALWLESRRRQYWDEHPDLWRRREARRALHRERRKLLAAAQAHDARGFAASGIQAIRLACAPHFPAEPRALVCGDVLQLLPEAERAGESGAIVRRLFRATDAWDFSNAPADSTRLLEMQPELDRLLTNLEVRL